MLAAACGLNTGGTEGAGDASTPAPALLDDGGGGGGGGDSGGDTDGSPTADGATPGAEAGDANTEDVGSPTPPACAKGAIENCTDGVDNDCNGLADCADPACTAGFSCTNAAIPSGWTVVAFADAARDACPSGFGAPADLVDISTTAPAGCTCTCVENAPAHCEVGTINLYSTGTGACGTTPVTTRQGNGGACSDSQGLTTVRNGTVRVTPLPPVQATCTPSVATALPPPAGGRSCTAPSGGAGCKAAGACVPKASGNYGVCIQVIGDAACPSGWPQKRAVGTGTGDTRACSPCACASAASCVSPTMTLYTDGACNAGAHPLTVDDQCDPVNDGRGQTYSTYRYAAAVVNGSCGVAVGTTPVGQLSLTGKRTICCP